MLYEEESDIRGKWFIIAAACMCAEALNFLCVLLFCTIAHIPLFLDTIGTVAITFYAGLIPGLIVAILYNVLWVVVTAAMAGNAVYIMDMVYALCGIAIVISTWFFARKKQNFSINSFTTFLYLILIAIVSAIASSIIGGIIETTNRVVFDGASYKTSVLDPLIHLLLGEKLKTFIACVIARIPITSVDRLICTFAGFSVYKLITLNEESQSA